MFVNFHLNITKSRTHIRHLNITNLDTKKKSIVWGRDLNLHLNITISRTHVIHLNIINPDTINKRSVWGRELNLHLNITNSYLSSQYHNRRHPEKKCTVWGRRLSFLLNVTISHLNHELRHQKQTHWVSAYWNHACSCTWVAAGRILGSTCGEVESIREWLSWLQSLIRACLYLLSSCMSIFIEFVDTYSDGFGAFL